MYWSQIMHKTTQSHLKHVVLRNMLNNFTWRQCHSSYLSNNQTEIYINSHNTVFFLIKHVRYSSEFTSHFWIGFSSWHVILNCVVLSLVSSITNLQRKWLNAISDDKKHMFTALSIIFENKYIFGHYNIIIGISFIIDMFMLFFTYLKMQYGIA